jgi:hypothetical protein
VGIEESPILELSKDKSYFRQVKQQSKKW